MTICNLLGTQAICARERSRSQALSGENLGTRHAGQWIVSQKVNHISKIDCQSAMLSGRIPFRLLARAVWKSGEKRVRPGNEALTWCRQVQVVRSPQCPRSTLLCFGTVPRHACPQGEGRPGRFQHHQERKWAVERKEGEGGCHPQAWRLLIKHCHM